MRSTRANSAELLRAEMLSPVHPGEKSAQQVQHLARSYAMLTEDTTRVMGRLKALFRSHAIPCAGKKLYGRKHRDEYLAELGAGALRRRAECLYAPLKALQQLRRQAKREMIVECRKYPESKLRRSCSVWFRFWVWCGGGADWPGADAAPLPHQAPVLGLLRLALEMRDNGEYRLVEGSSGTEEKAGADSRLELEPQPRVEEPVQGGGHFSQRLRRSRSRVLSWAVEEDYAAGDSAADVGA
jgi:hypothetical protein